MTLNKYRGRHVRLPVLVILLKGKFYYIKNCASNIVCMWLAVFYVYELYCSFVWGRLADVWSRKNVFMWSAVGIAFSCFLFGFSTNFFMVIIARFFVGLLNGKWAWRTL